MPQMCPKQGNILTNNVYFLIKEEKIVIFMPQMKKILASIFRLKF